MTESLSCDPMASLTMSVSGPSTDAQNEAMQYEYEVDEATGGRVVLGQGSFGTVFSTIDTITKRKMAVKEITEKNIEWVFFLLHIYITLSLSYFLISFHMHNYMCVISFLLPFSLPPCPSYDYSQFQSVQEEINLHRHLQHKNIVQYFGAQSTDGVFKIFMELVPGGLYIYVPVYM